MPSPKSIAAAVLLATTALCSQVLAQTQAPGLWEHSFMVRSQSGELERAQAQMQAQLAVMPPERRRQFEEMMAGRGVKVGAEGTTARFCLTKEQAARPAEPPMTGDCHRTDIDRSGDTIRYKFACTTPRPVSGEGQVSFGDKRYSGTSNITTDLAGQPQRLSIDMSGRWLGADCGDVKPLGASRGP